MGLVKLNDRGARNATTFGSLSGGSMIFIKKLTASASGTLDFLNGTSDVVFDDTYKEYLFTFKNIHPSGDGADGVFKFQVDTGTNTSYNQTMTTTSFRAYHDEAASTQALEYSTGVDQGQGTGFQDISDGIGNGNDESTSGYLYLFAPSDTTFVKHFIAESNAYQIGGPTTNNSFIAGYGNTTSAVDAIQFKFHSGDIDSGDICLYGLTT